MHEQYCQNHQKFESTFLQYFINIQDFMLRTQLVKFNASIRCTGCSQTASTSPHPELDPNPSKLTNWCQECKWNDSISLVEPRKTNDCLIVSKILTHTLSLRSQTHFTGYSRRVQWQIYLDINITTVSLKHISYNAEQKCVNFLWLYKAGV